MGIGVGIFLAAVGAILAFAVHTNVNGIDLATVGVILIIAGIVGVALDLAIWAPRRRRVTVTRADDAYAAPVAGRTVTRTSRTDVV